MRVRDRNCSARRRCRFYEDLMSPVLAKTQQNQGLKQTSDLPFSAGRPEIIWYGFLFGIEKFAAEYKHRLNDAVDIGGRRRKASGH